MDISSDILIVGGGVIGCAVARELSRYEARITLLEQADDVAEGASKANSGIVHAGYDAIPGTLKARYNVEGAAMMPALCEALGVPFRTCGALVIGFTQEDRHTLEGLVRRGQANGVAGLKLIGGEEARALEPHLNPQVCCALLVPSSGIVSPYELTFALADDAAVNGVVFRLNTRAEDIERTEDGGFLVRTNGDTHRARTLILCAGASCALLHNRLSPRPLALTHRRGQYYLLDRPAVLPFERTVFQCPSAMGKGVLVSPTVHGNVLLGPTAEDIDDPMDTATTGEGLAAILEKARLTWPGLSTRTNITNFSGIRAHEAGDDFLVGPVEGCPGAYEAAGIESPGLSSAPAIGLALSARVAGDLGLRKKTGRVAYPRPAKPFREMSAEEQSAAVEQNPLCGRIVCRCEVVTEAEIVAAIQRPVGARSIDAVKRRTRAGMGRCQGGFCSPRVAAILSEYTDTPMERITKNGGESYLLTGTIGEATEGGGRT